MSTDVSIEEKKSDTKNNVWLRAGIFFTTLGILIFIGVFSYGYFQLARINSSLAGMITKTQSQTSILQNEVNDLKTSLAKTQAFINKNENIFTQQEKVMLEWQQIREGNLQKWELAEAQNLVKQANDEIQFSHHYKIASVLLARADAILAKIDNPNVLALRQTIHTNLATLENLNDVDVTAIYLQLNTLDQMVDALHLPTLPLSSKSDMNAQKSNAGLPWYRVGFNNAIGALKEIVVVRDISNDNHLPLVLPDEKNFLYQNLHASFSDVMWALLARNNSVYQASLDRAKKWVQTYFDNNDEGTKRFLENIAKLQSINIEPPVVKLSDAMPLFDNVLVNQTKVENAQ